MNNTAEQITKNILNSKKYKHLYPKTVKRVVENCVYRYNNKQAEKKARNVLHQIWASYRDSRPNFNKFTKNFEQDLRDGKSVKESLIPILSTQSSTAERVPILDKFYKNIFDITGTPKTILDYACGLNPLTIPWMNLPRTTTYFGCDIDKEQIEFIKSILSTAELDNVTLETKDILVDSFEYVDVALMLKLLPPLEKQQKDISEELIKNTKCNYLVVSFPVKSLSGKEKGMKEFYKTWFNSLIEGFNLKSYKLEFETELVFVVKKH